VKLVELADAGRGNPRVERLRHRGVAEGRGPRRNITNLDAVVDAVQRAWKRMATRTKNVALACHGAVITKKIIVPAGCATKSWRFRSIRANQYIPFALEEVNLDFQVVGPSPSGPDEVEVLIAASRKEKVEDRVAVAEASGLKAIVMDVESYAIQASFELIQQQFPDSGKDQKYRTGRSGRERHERHGAAQRTDRLHARAGVRRQSAHAGHHARVRHEPGGSRSGKTLRRAAGELRIRSAAPLHGERGVEIQRAVQFFFTSTQYTSVEHVLLTGARR